MNSTLEILSGWRVSGKVSHRLQSQKMLVGKTKYKGVFVEHSIHTAFMC